MWRLAVLCAIASCGPRAPVATEAPAAAEPAEPASANDKEQPDPLFPERQHGWKALDAAGREQARAFAADYAQYLDSAPTPRRAVTAMAERFAAGATELTAGARPPAEAGARYWFAGPGGDAAVFVRTGARPVADGLRIVVAAIDAPRIELKASPIHGEGNIVMLDTHLYGPLDLAAWLTRPLALHLHAARPGSSAGAIDLVIGDSDDEPVLVIPDLLPHLSGRVQGRAVVDQAERMDAIAARTLAGLSGFLREHGLDDSAFAEAEVSLVPAARASFIGVDRTLLAGYGHGHRALAYAAVRALLDGQVPQHTAVVVLISKNEIGGTGASGIAFVEPALRRVIAALHGAADPDVLDVARTLSGSAALIARRIDGERNAGVILDPVADDALPVALRRALDSLRAAGAQVQIVAEGGWDSYARGLATLDLDAVDIGLPLSGVGAPLEIVSVLDLYSGYLAALGWLTGS